MKFTELLPIGSVVLLHGAQKRLMIYGVGQEDMTNKITYDYIGVAYPEGNMGEGTQFLFNHGDIEEICFRGFEDEEREKFITAVQQMYDANQIS